MLSPRDPGHHNQIASTQRAVAFSFKTLNDPASNIVKEAMAICCLATSDIPPEEKQRAVDLIIKKIVVAEEIPFETSDLIGFELLQLQARTKIEQALAQTQPGSLPYNNLESVLDSIKNNEFESASVL